ncbi:MAG: LysM domain-containing protein [Xylophilus ampelinus]
MRHTRPQRAAAPAPTFPTTLAVPGVRRRLLLAGAGLLAGVRAAAQTVPAYPVTERQRAVAQQTAETGIPESELAPNAPDRYVVRAGDTLWDIAGMFLRSPWRWPELWGMNLQDIRNPHLIYPGQTLYLERSGGRARLATRPGGALDGGLPTVRVSPRTRSESLADSLLPTLKPHLIEPFLAEPLVVDENTLLQAPRLVGVADARVLITRGDRAYVRSSGGPALAEPEPRTPPSRYRVFRNARALVDPASGAVLGYEAQYVGRAVLIHGESEQAVLRDGKELREIVPASVDITGAKEEMRVGDRLLPEPPRQFPNYVPRAPEVPIDNARVVSIYGSAVASAAQNQVVSINKGSADGLAPGHVLALLSEGARIVDASQPGERTRIKLPDERNGVLMVFRTFERVSYGLILQIREGVKVGDRLVSPR